MVVDDDHDDQQFFCYALEKITPGIDCIIANNGKEAMQHLETPPPYDLIFLDLNMPIMNGYETLFEIKTDSRFINIPVIIISTTHNTFEVERCKRLGADHFFQKPT